MDIIKAFNNNNLHTEIIIKGTYKNPLFRASDIGLILGIKYIHNSIKDFNENEKVTHTIGTLGGPQEVTFLTAKGLYKTLFKSRKPIAETFQNWVYEVIEELRLTGTYELEKKLNEKEDEKQKLEDEKQIIENELENKKLLLAKIQKRNKKKFDNKDRVYIYEDTSSDNELVYKVGYSGNMNLRMVTYDSTRYENKLKFEIISSNGRILEAVVHHMLRSVADIEKNDWFHTTFDIVKNTILTAQYFIDELFTDNINSKKITDISQSILLLMNKSKNINLLDINSIETDNNENNEEIEDEYEDEDEEEYDEETKENEEIFAQTVSCEENEETKDNEETKETKETKENEEPIDTRTKYEKFFDENCVFETDSYSASINLYAAFRNWNHNCTREERFELNQYFQDNFFFQRKWNEEAKSHQGGFKGVKLIENRYIPKNSELNMFDNFIMENCTILSVARVSTLAITNNFIEWIKINNISIPNEDKLKFDFRKHLTKHFLPTNGKFIYNGRPDCGGFWGITLKSKHEIIEGCFSKENNKKKVYKIDPKTNEIIETFNSAGECAKIYSSNVYNKIKNKIIYRDFLFSYENPHSENTSPE
jgi:prophage antirepressor-like protein